MRKGISSVLIGMVGLMVITYFYLQAEESQEALGEIQHLVTLYPMSLPLRVFLFTLEVLGVWLGYLAYRGRHIKSGLFGIGLCTLCLILLFNYTF